MSKQHIPSVVSTSRPLGYYRWGTNCAAWKLVDSEDLAVKHEKMPPGSEELLHFHNHAQQFFYVLKGRAVMEIEEAILILHPGDGLHVVAGQQHRIMNKEEESVLEFLVCSQPGTENDRINVV